MRAMFGKLPAGLFWVGLAAAMALASAMLWALAQDAIALDAALAASWCGEAGHAPGQITLLGHCAHCWPAMAAAAISAGALVQAARPYVTKRLARKQRAYG